MEWRYVCSRSEIWNDRSALLANGVSYRNPLLVSPQCITFLNSYQEKCSQGILTPVWPQDFRKANHSHGESASRSAWRGSTEPKTSASAPASSDFQRFAGQAWQPQVLNPYNARMKDLRNIFNKWTPKNHDSMREEFQTWWKNSGDFGYWKPFFVIYEWFRKIQTERVAQSIWYDGVFKTFLGTGWPTQASERQVNSKMKNYLYDGVNSLPRDWIQYWNFFQKEHQVSTIISWKKWTTTAIELVSRQWLEAYEKQEDDNQDGIAPYGVMTHYLATMWYVGILPLRFLPWAMFVLPLKVNDEVAWKWRSYMWEALEECQLEHRLVEYRECWERFKVGFEENAKNKLKPNVDSWGLRLRYKWSVLCPSWGIGITENVLEQKRKEIEPKVEECCGVEETEWDSDFLTNEDMKHVRCLIMEWKEMGKQGWMDSYFPDFYMEKGEYEKKMNWWNVFLDIACQNLDMNLIWKDDSWVQWLKWILECSQDSNLWLGDMLDKMERTPPEWTIDCPLYSKLIDEMRVRFI